MTIKKARAEIVAELQTLDEIRQAPDGVPDQAQFPFAVAFASRGYYEGHTQGAIKGMHNLAVELHVIREPDMERAYDEMEPLVDLVMEHLYRKMFSRNWTTIQTFERITYDIRPSWWGKIKTLSVLFTVINTKVITTL